VSLENQRLGSRQSVNRGLYYGIQVYRVYYVQDGNDDLASNVAPLAFTTVSLLLCAASILLIAPALYI